VLRLVFVEYFLIRLERKETSFNWKRAMESKKRREGQEEEEEKEEEEEEKEEISNQKTKSIVVSG